MTTDRLSLVPAISPTQAKRMETHHEQRAFSKDGICLPCMGFPKDPEKVKYILNAWGERWNATWELSEDGRFAKFARKDEATIVEQ